MRQIIHLILACLLVLQTQAQMIIVIKKKAAGGQVTLDTDNFGGTAGTALATYNANWDGGSPYGCNDGAISTGSNGVSGSFVSCFGRTGQTWTNDQFVQATLVLAAVADSAYICLRVTSTGSLWNAYCFGTSPGTLGTSYRTVKFTSGGSGVTLHGSSITPVNGDVLNFQIIGNTFQVKINGSVVSEFSTTDSTWTTGNPGMYITHTTTVKVFSTWTAGSAS